MGVEQAVNSYEQTQVIAMLNKYPFWDHATTPKELLSGSPKDVRIDKTTLPQCFMSIALPPCPACQSTHTVKNGTIHNGKQNFTPLWSL